MTYFGNNPNESKYKKKYENLIKQNIDNYNKKESWNKYEKYLKEMVDEEEKYEKQLILSLVNKNTKKNKPFSNIKRNKYEKTNQLDILNNILDKVSKKIRKKDDPYYQIKLERNKTLIKLYSYLYKNKNNLIDGERQELIEEEKIRDLNSSRFNKYCNIYNKIYNNEKIFSSNYIFLAGLFDKLNKKYVDLLI